MLMIHLAVVFSVRVWCELRIKEGFFFFFPTMNIQFSQSQLLRRQFLLPCSAEPLLFYISSLCRHGPLFALVMLFYLCIVQPHVFITLSNYRGFIISLEIQ